MRGEGTLLKLNSMGLALERINPNQKEKLLAKNLRPPIFAVL